MNKLTALLAAVFLAATAAIVGLAGPASATNDKTQITGKAQGICHATGQDDKYVSMPDLPVDAVISVDRNGNILDDQSKHSGHQDGRDIIPAFDFYYNDADGEQQVGHFPGQGDTTLLAFPNCERPAEKVLIDRPEPTFADPCGVKHDVFSVPAGANYSVGNVVTGASDQSITVTAADGFLFKPAPGTETVTFTKPLFTNVDCDLPETGVGATFNTTGGYMALGALALGGVFLVTGGRFRKASSNI